MRCRLLSTILLMIAFEFKLFLLRNVVVQSEYIEKI